MLVNVLNPKLSIFFLAFLTFLTFLSQFVSPVASDALPRMLGLSAVFMFLTLVVFVGYGMGAAAFVALGARLALTDR